MLPVWADVLIVAAIPVILLLVLKFYGNKPTAVSSTSRRTSGTTTRTRTC